MFENYLPFYFGGLGIALIALLSILIGGDYLGITRGYASICSIFSRRKSLKKVPFMQKILRHTLFFSLFAIVVS
ncbi:MAG: hypothetical protein N3A69_08320, partial [Leptospiraceae bacterium]|nr:hypothetical protein [Leptospiraceae bacterium]